MRVIILTLLTLVIVTAKAQTHYGGGVGSSGTGHTYYGYYSGASALTSSSENSFIGSYSGRYTTSATSNTAVGYKSLEANTTGNWNVALGGWAMVNNTTGYRNTGIGRGSMYNNSTGTYNTGVGWNSLFSSENASENTAVGARSLYGNIWGERNVAIGRDALFNNTASQNTAVGAFALVANTSGYDNVAIGENALLYNTIGSGNTAIGARSLKGMTGSNNTAVGVQTFNTDISSGCGSNNSVFGSNAGPLQSIIPCDIYNSTALGAGTYLTTSNQVRIGSSNVTSIGGFVQWTVLSDGRFKKDLKKDVAGLSFINQLNPVSYTFDKKAINSFFSISEDEQAQQTRADLSPRRQVGFIAQEVEAIISKSGYVFTGVETPQNEHDPYTIRYAEFVVPLVKAVQELSAELDKVKQQLKGYQSVSSQTLTSASGGAFLYQNSPNPFTTTTEIKMDIPEGNAQAQVIIYNLEGKQLKNIKVNDRGTTTVQISASDLSAGMYLYTLMIDGKVADTKRLILTE